MQTQYRFLLAAAALLCLLCALSPAALATTMEIVPLDEADGYQFEYYLAGSDVSLILPVGATPHMEMDDAEYQAVSIAMPGQENVSYVFFAIWNEGLKGQSIANMDEAGILRVLEVISHQAASLTYTFVDDLASGTRLLRVYEPADDLYAEHLVALRDGWVLNLMIGKMNTSEASLDEAILLQNRIMAAVFNREGIFKRYQSLTVPGSEITLSVPDTLHLTLAIEDPGFYEILVVPTVSGGQFGVAHVFAVRDPAYQGQTILTLSDAGRAEAMRMPTASEPYDADTVAVLQDFENGQPVISYESATMGKHLLALRDGWAVYVTATPLPGRVDPAWMGLVQEQIMRQLLGGEAVISDWVPVPDASREATVLEFPLSDAVLRIAVPDGYGVDLQSDNEDERDIYLYALDGSPKYYNITSLYFQVDTGTLTLKDLYTAEDIQEISDEITKGINANGLTASSQFIDAGPGGYPAIRSTTLERLTEQYTSWIDSHMVNVSFFSHDEPITEEESAALLAMIQIQ